MNRIYSFIGIFLLFYLIFFAFFCVFIIPKKNNSIYYSDAIIVLTGGKNRISVGLELLIAGKAKKLLITGVAKGIHLKDIEYSNNELPIKYVQNLQNRISLGYMATNTKENAIEAKDWINNNNIKSIILVTSNYHMPRSIFEFKLALPQINIIENPVIIDNFINKDSYKIYYMILIEYNKYLIVKLIDKLNRILI